jgi:hypothetical protein
VHKRSTWATWSTLAIFGVGCEGAVALLVARGDGFGQGGVTLLLAFTAFMVVGAMIVSTGRQRYWVIPFTLCSLPPT